MASAAARRAKRRKAASKALPAQNPLTLPQTAGQLKRETNAAARTKFGPAVTDTHAQQRASGQQQKNITNWYDQYKNDLAASYQRTAAGYAAAASTITGARDSATLADTARQNSLNSQDQASAQSRGATVDPAVAQRGSQAITASQASSNRDLAQVASTGAAVGSYAAAKIPNAQGQAIAAHQQESGRRRTIDASLKDLNSQKADFKLAYKAQARKDSLNNQIAVNAGLLKRDTLNANIKDDNAKNKLTQDKQAETARHDAVSEANTALANSTTATRDAALNALTKTQKNLLVWQKHHHKGPFLKHPQTTVAQQLAIKKLAINKKYGTGPYKGSKPTPKKPTKESEASHTFKGNVSDVIGYVRRNSNNSEHDLRKALVNGQPAKNGAPGRPAYSRDAVNAAYDIITFGYISPANARALKRRGVRIPKEWRIGSHRPARGTH